MPRAFTWFPAPARDGSHRRDVGRILFWKRTRPHTPEEKHQGVSTSPWTPNDTKAGDLGLRLWKPIPKGTRARLAFAPQRPGKQPESTVTATRFSALAGRQSCHFPESTLLYPPMVALWCFPLWKLLPETGDGAGKTNPQGDEGRETRIKQETN